MPDPAPIGTTNRCPACDSEYATRLLACPQCHRLTYANELKALASAAEEASRAGDPSRALASWREALALLPPASRQYQTIEAKVVARIEGGVSCTIGGTSDGIVAR